jgi:hypothetical protein
LAFTTHVSFDPLNIKMTITSNQRGSKRAAAALAAAKIKKTLEEVASWSDDGEMKAKQVPNEMNDFEDSKKQRRKEADVKADRNKNKKKPTKKTKKSKASVPAKKHLQRDGISDDETSKTSNETSLNESPSPTRYYYTFSFPEDHLDTDLAREKERQRQKKALARRQHSNGPMFLSRRLSYNMNRSSSPPSSPIHSTSLQFASPDIVVLKVRRI